MKEEEKTMSLAAVQLMADLQFVNLTSSTKGLAEGDLRAVQRKLEGMEKITNARKLLERHIIAQDKVGVVHMWVDAAFHNIVNFEKEFMAKLKEEETRLTTHIANLEQELEEHKKKKAERKKRREDNGNIQDTPI